MNVNVTKIDGPWDLGFVLDRQIIKSTFLGYDNNGNPQFDTERTEVGEALFQLKYRSDLSFAESLANVLVTELGSIFSSTDIVIPMPASKERAVQPVFELAKKVASKMGKTYREDLLVKASSTPQMKDLKEVEEKRSSLKNALKCNDVLSDETFNVLIVDDIFSSGSSLEVACEVLKKYKKVNQVFVAVLTRTKG
ncbi:MAG: ComF family protein [Bacteriovoracaceae bacterium]|nr:ComF family protein [Bacteriovoracaceae bacterium]